jgi:ketosteroid isomerase-like protein
MRFVERPNLVSPRGSERDREQVLASVEVGRQLLRDQRFEVVDPVVEGDRVASRVVWTGTLAVEAPPYAAGAQLRADSSMHFTLRDGRIAHQENFDCFQAPADA